jgi:molybdopterin biosynthesis enzyme
MDAYSDSVQRIARLTPLREVLRLMAENVDPVAPRRMALADALGRTLAADVVAPHDVPDWAVALRDGVAVAADLIADAGAYAAIPLPADSVWVDSGEALPPGCDAVAPPDTVSHSAFGAEATAPIAPAEGVLAAGADAAAGAVLGRAGERLDRTRRAMLAGCGIAEVAVRSPRVRLCRASARPNLVAGTADLIAAALAAAGAIVWRDDAPPALETVLEDGNADAVVAVGGTGSGRGDHSVATLQRCGRVAVHGVGIAPGETSAFGFVEHRPVLLLPGRLDAALAAWLLLGVPLLRRLAGGTAGEETFAARLTRKVTSALGLAELVPVRRGGEGEVEPLARAPLPFAALARADGWILVGADSEGFPSGAVVQVRRLP